MTDDIAFKIQLGLILPKIKEKIGGELHQIVEELTAIYQSGSIDHDDDISADLEAIKALFIKDMEIYLDKEVMPAIHQSLAPVSSELETSDELTENDDIVPQEQALEEESA